MSRMIFLVLCLLLCGCQTYAHIQEQKQIEYAELSKRVDAHKIEMQERRKKYVKDHPNLSPAMKDGILNKKPVLGMNTEQIKLSFGHEPCEITKVVNFNGSFELWRYDCLWDREGQYKYLTFSNNLLVSWTE